MTSDLTAIDFPLDYTSTSANLVDDFYVPCLDASSRYDRAVGYFRSTVYHLVGVALSDFALRGGVMRLVCSPNLEDRDREAILSSEAEAEEISASLASDLRDHILRPDGRPVTELLATLIAVKCLEIRIAYRPGCPGIFHLKRGIFMDAAGNAVAIEGSDNETFMAWDEFRTGPTMAMLSSA